MECGMLKKTVVALVALLALPFALSAEVFINEIQSSNDETLLDEGGESPDWIELYNAAATNVDLSGWALTDKPEKPAKWWYFPSGTTIKAGGHLVVFCDSTGVAGPTGPTEQLAPDDATLKDSLAAWYRADDLTGTDGAAVASWTDRSGRGNAATGTSGKCPTLKKNAVNGYAALSFASSKAQRLAIPTGNLGMNNMAEVTVIVVGNWNGGVDGNFSGFYGVTHGASKNNTCLQIGTSVLRVQFDTSNRIKASTITKNAWFGMGFTTASAGREGALTCVFKDGEEGGEGTPQSGSRTTAFGSSSAMYIGFAPYQGSTGAYFDGQVCEVIVYSRALTKEEYGKVWSGLAAKYGIGGGTSEAHLHASFSMSGDGETVALFDRTAAQVDSVTFGALPCDTSYGRTTDGGGTFAWFADPTPKGSNNGIAAYDSPLEPVVFSVGRGLFDAPFDVTLSHPAEGVTIRYTTDRSEPTETHGTVYGGTPITVSKTTNLRAAAFKAGHLPYRNVTTHTYLFLDTVKDQQKHNATYPDTWKDTLNGQTLKCPASYRLSANVLKTDADRAAFVAALKATPIVSVTLSDEALFNSEDGLYIHPTSMEDREAVQADVEWLTGDYVFGTGVGLDMHGAYSRRFDITAKKSFKLRFKGKFGEGSLGYPVLATGGCATDSFKKLVLRGENNHAWTSMERDNGGGHPELGMSMNDQFLRSLQKQMSGFQPEGTHVHLFLNGLYWGLYNITDHVCDGFAATTWSGDIDLRKNYDVISNSGLRDGTTTAFNSIKSGIGTSLDSAANYASYSNRFDYAAYIDYLLIQWFGANEDWPGNNWAVAGSDKLGVPYRYLMWDGDKGFRIDNLSSLMGQTSGAMEIHNKLKAKAEYKLMFADRIHKHLFNDGALTLGSLTNRYAALGRRVRSFVFAESARWGAYTYENWSALPDSQHPQTTKPSAPYGLTDWDKEYKRLTTVFFPSQCANLLTKLKSAGFYPSVAAAEFTTNNTRTVTLASAVPTGAKVYYTTDGRDPRVAFAGTAAEGAYTYGTGGITLPDEACTLKARVLSGTTWSALTEITFAEPQTKPNVLTADGKDVSWNVAGNWELGRVPDAPGAIAVIGVPKTLSKKGQRSVELSAGVTVGCLEFTNGAATNRIVTAASGDLTLCGAIDASAGETNAATVVVTDAGGEGFARLALDPPNAVRLGSDMTVIVSNSVVNAEGVGLVIEGVIAGNGHNLLKLGPGRLTLACTNAADASTVDKLQVEEGVVAIEAPLEVGSVTKKTGTVWLQAAGTDLESGVAGALVSRDKFNPSLCLFVPTATGSETAKWYGGLVCASVPKAPTVYVLSEEGEVGFCGERWTVHGDVEIETVDVIVGSVTGKTYKVFVPYFGPRVEVTATVSGKGTVEGTGAHPLGSDVVLTAVPAAGYGFAEWTTNGVAFSTETPVTIPCVVEPLTVGARFTPNTYTIVYRPGEGTGEDIPQSVAYEAAHTVLDCPFTREGYAFVSWLSDGETHLPGAVVSNLTAEAGGSVDFTAQWEKLPPIPEDPAETTNEVTLAVGESVTVTNRFRKNPRHWLLGGSRRQTFVAAALDVEVAPVSDKVGYASRSTVATNEVVITITGVKKGEEDVFLGRQYKRKDPRTAVRYHVIVK